MVIIEGENHNNTSPMSPKSPILTARQFSEKIQDKITDVESGAVSSITRGISDVIAETNQKVQDLIVNLGYEGSRPRQTIPATGITLDIKQANLYENPLNDKGYNIVITAKVTPSNATNVSYVWKISDTSIADITVIRGRKCRIRGLKPGKAKLYCYVGDKQQYCASTDIEIMPHKNQIILFGATNSKLEPNVFSGFSANGKAKFDYVEKVDPKYYQGLNYLVHFTYPVDRIPAYAFRYNKNFVTVVLPPTVTEIDNNAFAYCSNLTSIGLPYGLKRIGLAVFYSDSQSKKGLTHFTLPDTLEVIEGLAFKDCRCKTLHIPAGVKMHSAAFWDSAINDVYIHSRIPDEVDCIFCETVKVHVPADAYEAYRKCSAYANVVKKGNLIADSSL